MVFKFLFIVCAFLVWGGQEYLVPPYVCLLGRGFFYLSLFMLALGRVFELLWEEGWRGRGGWGGFGGGVVCLFVRVAPCSLLFYYPIISYRKIKVYRVETIDMGRSHCNNDVSGTILMEQWCQWNYSTYCTR